MLNEDQVAILSGLPSGKGPGAGAGTLARKLAGPNRQRRADAVLAGIVARRWVSYSDGPMGRTYHLTPQGKIALRSRTPHVPVRAPNMSAPAGPWPVIDCWTWLSEFNGTWVQVVGLRSEPEISPVALPPPRTVKLLSSWWFATAHARALLARDPATDENHPDWPSVPLWGWKDDSADLDNGVLWVSTEPEDEVEATDVWLPADPEEFEPFARAVERALCLAGGSYDPQQALRNLAGARKRRSPTPVKVAGRSVRTVSGGLPGLGKRR